MAEIAHPPSTVSPTHTPLPSGNALLPPWQAPPGHSFDPMWQSFKHRFVVFAQTNFSAHRTSSLQLSSYIAVPGGKQLVSASPTIVQTRCPVHESVRSVQPSTGVHTGTRMTVAAPLCRSGSAW